MRYNNYDDFCCGVLPDKPFFIVFEGLDGSGKTTLAQKVAKKTSALYMTTPSPAIRNIREILLEDFGDSQEAQQLFYLATVFSASEQIRNTLAAGQSVVLDRYFLSTQAYAEFRGSKLDLETTSDLLIPPDLTFYLDTPLGIRRSRIMTRGASKSDLETFSIEADISLRSLHLNRVLQKIVGQLVVLNTDQFSITDCVTQICQKISELKGN